MAGSMVDPPRGCDSSTGSGTAAPRGSLVWVGSAILYMWFYPLCFFELRVYSLILFSTRISLER
ncbi:hypothetical protein P168DRAFT_110567 [Aspergillus campestris IBT 28561]|uniref:Uncharacterized protein n=1 Tax=Aspergillus campestris (strain IBT 28561) TaxID=1392248 RepID=A0A2I1D913_ASPC2|nr:uncharacterized protein P168DRAFT_110567 [Aspergillus campestris IBT 28561]PKY06371.1 hypothetical protein P168DRAFT_110567 [Aspergillus campestris IBT 28561]